MDEQEFADWKAKIGQMTHLEMARLYRFAEAGHPIFDKREPLWEIFDARFRAFGGFTPEISKAISP